MTRKDYEKIAAVLRTEDERLEARSDKRIVRSVILTMADMLYLDNPRFDHAKFYAACGLTY